MMCGLKEIKIKNEVKVTPHSIQALADKFGEINFIGCPALNNDEVVWIPNGLWLIVSMDLYHYLKSEEDNHDRSTLSSIYISSVLYEPIDKTRYASLVK